jgi:hypothetical protein
VPQMQMLSVARSVAVEPVSSRRFVRRLVVSSISSLAGLISLVLTGPAMYRIAAIDQALESFYGALLVGWLGSLGRMWFITFQDRNQNYQPQVFTPNLEERRATMQASLGKMSAYVMHSWRDRAASSIEQTVAAFLELGEAIATRWVQTTKAQIQTRQRGVRLQRCRDFMPTSS